VNVRKLGSAKKFLCISGFFLGQSVCSATVTTTSWLNCIIIVQGELSMSQNIAESSQIVERASMMITWWTDMNG
jgi:RNA polymerase subunit RPABC4/transcription elongation factor Spt4